MAAENYKLFIDGEGVDGCSLEFHFQGNPYPGGKSYELRISDPELISVAKTDFGLGTHRSLDREKVVIFLLLFRPIMQMKAGRTDPRFWANTIDYAEVSETQLLLKGVSSPHVSASWENIRIPLKA